MMKIAVSLLCIYLLCLSVAPCSCDEVLVYNEITTPQQLDSADSHSDDKGFSCSPFCHCSNSHYPNFIAREEIKKTTFIFIIKDLTSYTDSYSPILYDSMWHPPQLVL